MGQYFALLMNFSQNQILEQLNHVSNPSYSKDLETKQRFIAIYFDPSTKPFISLSTAPQKTINQRSTLPHFDQASVSVACVPL